MALKLRLVSVRCPHGYALAMGDTRLRSSGSTVRGGVVKFAAVGVVSICFCLPVAAQDRAIPVARFAQLALDCVHREYPNKLAHVLASDEDVRPPRELTPAFYGCFDWHSAVHGHWLLARLARLYPEADFADPARRALGLSLTLDHISGEVAYFQAPGRAGFERPYGLAWVLQLAAELREWDDPEARRWQFALAPLERAAAVRIKDWLPQLNYPIRAGEHSQTAFALALIYDWARVAADAGMVELLTARSGDHYGDDRNCPLSYEPSGQDFLSPCLAEADLMRRVIEPDRFTEWLGQLLPDIPIDGDPHDWLETTVVSDASDGQLMHLAGLNLSRAWMLEGIASALAEDDARRVTLLTVANQHRDAGLAVVTSGHYEGEHWLGTFATYLVTARGLR